MYVQKKVHKKVPKSSSPPLASEKNKPLAGTAPDHHSAVPPKPPPRTKHTLPQSWDELLSLWYRERPLSASSLSYARVRTYNDKKIWLVFPHRPENSEPAAFTEGVEEFRKFLTQRLGFTGTFDLQHQPPHAGDSDATEEGDVFASLPPSPGERLDHLSSLSLEDKLKAVTGSSVHKMVLHYFPKCSVSLKQIGRTEKPSLRSEGSLI